MEATNAITDPGQPAGLAAFGIARSNALAGHQPDQSQVLANAERRDLSTEAPRPAHDVCVSIAARLNKPETQVELPRIASDISARIASSTNPALTSVCAVSEQLVSFEATEDCLRMVTRQLCAVTM